MLCEALGLVNISMHHEVIAFCAQVYASIVCLVPRMMIEDEEVPVLNTGVDLAPFALTDKPDGEDCDDKNVGPPGDCQPRYRQTRKVPCPDQPKPKQHKPRKASKAKAKAKAKAQTKAKAQSAPKKQAKSKKQTPVEPMPALADQPEPAAERPLQGPKPKPSSKDSSKEQPKPKTKKRKQMDRDEEPSQKRDRCKTKKFNEIWDGLSTDSQDMYLSLPTRAQKTMFINKNIERTAEGRLQPKREIMWQQESEKRDKSKKGSEMNGVVLAEALGKVGGSMDNLKAAIRSGSVVKTSVRGLEVTGADNTSPKITFLMLSILCLDLQNIQHKKLVLCCDHVPQCSSLHVILTS